MAEPGGAQPAGGWPGPALERVQRWQRSARHAALAATDELAERRHRHAGIAQARHDGLHITKPITRPEGRSLHALEPRTGRSLAQRPHAVCSTGTPTVLDGAHRRTSPASAIPIRNHPLHVTRYM